MTLRLMSLNSKASSYSSLATRSYACVRGQYVFPDRLPRVKHTSVPTHWKTGRGRGVVTLSTSQGPVYLHAHENPVQRRRVGAGGDVREDVQGDARGDAYAARRGAL
jgi:hypothetical protein